MQRGARALLAIGLTLAAAQARAATFDLAIDVPSRLDGADYGPDQLLRRDGGATALLAQLPAGTALGALHRKADGNWLLVPDRPLVLGGVPGEPRDVLSWDGVGFALWFDGSAAGVPDGSRIDALGLDPLGRAVVSFDVPTTIGTATFLPADLALETAGVFAPYWTAAAAGVPSDANVVGADETADGRLVLTFDVPVELGGVEALPGQLVEWLGGTSFALYASDPSWPAATQLRDFALLPPAGVVPTALLVSRSGNTVTLDWSASCAATDGDYAVYEGTLGSFTTHVPRLCSTGGLETATFVPVAGNAYYLVVPRNEVSEGSYGLRSDGAERSASVASCRPQALGACGDASASLPEREPGSR